MERKLLAVQYACTNGAIPLQHLCIIALTVFCCALKRSDDTDYHIIPHIPHIIPHYIKILTIKGIDYKK